MEFERSTRQFRSELVVQLDKTWRWFVRCSREFAAYSLLAVPYDSQHHIPRKEQGKAYATSEIELSHACNSRPDTHRVLHPTHGMGDRVYLQPVLAGPSGSWELPGVTSYLVE